MKESGQEALQNLEERLLISLIRGLEEAKGDVELGYYKSLIKEINFKNSDGETALHIACRENKAKAVRFFLDNRVDAGEINSEKKFAIELTDSEEIQNLIKESKSWKYLEDEAASYLRIKAISSINLTKGIFDSSAWQNHIKKIEQFINFSNSEISKASSEETSQISSLTTNEISNQEEIEQNLPRENLSLAEKDSNNSDNPSASISFTDELTKNPREFEKRRLLRKAEAKPKIKALTKEKPNSEDEKLLNEAIENSAAQRQQIQIIEQQKLMELDHFITEIYVDLGFERSTPTDFEGEDKAIEILGILLTAAIMKKNYSVAEKILNHRLQDRLIDYKDKEDRSLLILACAASSFDIAKLLIEKGVDVKAYDSKGNSALHFCAAIKDQKIQGKAVSQESASEQACQSSEISQMIINQTANDWSFLSAKNSNTSSAFTLCCAPSGNWKVLKSLLQTEGYNNNSDQMPIVFLKTFTQQYQKYPKNLSGEINQETLKFLEIFEKLPKRAKIIKPELSFKPKEEAKNFPLNLK